MKQPCRIRSKFVISAHPKQSVFYILGMDFPNI